MFNITFVIEPTRILYFLLISGKTHDCAETLLSTLEVVLIHKRKKVTTQRLLSFTKRLAILALQLLHNSSLASMAILKSIIQVSTNNIYIKIKL